MGKKSKKTRVVYTNTTTKNPYITSTTNNKGTTSTFHEGTAFSAINDFVNSNMENLLEEYLNPTLNSITNQSKLNSYVDNLNKQSALNMENNIINPLSQRNMIRSSQATNLYNNLYQNNANQLNEYMQNLLSNSQKDTAAMLTNMLIWYMNGYNVLNDTQKQSLATSSGNALSQQSSSSDNNAQLMQLAAKIALSAAGV